ncbi:MAG: hypothetical protein ACTHWF_13425 [Brachybacterium sp.]
MESVELAVWAPASLRIIEGRAYYSAGLAATVGRAGYEVVEAARMNARGNRGVGK